MATVEEAANTFAKDMTTQNVAGLLMVFTPEAMMKAMAMQGQLQARAAEAMAQGRQPAPPTGYTVDLRGPEGDDQVVHISIQSSEGTAEMQTRWREIEGIWKVNDLSLVGIRDATGALVDPSGTTPASPA